MKNKRSAKTKRFSIHSIKLPAIGMYFLSIILLYLAGSYFGGILLFLFYSFILLPVFSLALILFAVNGIRFFQYFSTDHPAKGETIQYRVVLTNESWVPISEISSRFMQINPFIDRMIPDFNVSLKQGGSVEFTYEIVCSYRGIYHVGLDSVNITDIMNLITIKIPVWHKTFYVYPRIMNLSCFHFGIEGFHNKDAEKAFTGLLDNSLLKGIREYRKEEPIRNIYWKKFASIGRPVLKEYDTSATPEVTIYLDFFHNATERKQIETLEKEDVTVEILTALAGFYLQKNIRTTIRCPSKPMFNFSGYVSEDFEKYYKQTINLFSGPYTNPVHLFRMDQKNGTLESKSIIFITHRIDPDLFDIFEEYGGADINILVIFNHTNTDEGVRRKNKLFFNTLRDRGAKIIDVNSPHTIVKDLENHDTKTH